MKFHFELTAGRFIRKDVKQNLENSKKKLEFNYPDCQILLTENKSLWETKFHIEGKNLPDSVSPDIQKWMDELKKSEQ